MALKQMGKQMAKEAPTGEAKGNLAYMGDGARGPQRWALLGGRVRCPPNGGVIAGTGRCLRVRLKWRG